MGGGRDKKKKAKNAAAVLASKKKADNKKATTGGGGVRRILQTKDDVEGGVDAASSNDNLNDGGEDWDAILASYRTTSSQLTSSQLIPLAASDDDVDDDVEGGGGGGIFPKPPRGNFTWTYAPSNGLVYMFGGEYYNGVENVVFDELLCWTPPPDNNNNNNNKTGRWKRILTPPPHPPPRCAHSAVYYNAAIYIFGGENVTANIYHHYRDLWKFDIQSNTWTELRSSKGESPPPSARSGHRAIIYQQYMLLFGGFFESTEGDSIQFYNDIHVYDIVNHNWKEIKFSKLARLPPPRSACNLGLSLSSFSSSSSGNDNGSNEDNIKVKEDVLVVYGGYSKVKNVTTTNHQIEQHHQKGGGSSSASNMRMSSSSEGIVHVDTWILPLKYIINSVTSSSSSSRSSIPLSSSASWERIPRKGEYPSTRAGTTSVMLSSSQQSSLTNTNNNKYNNCMIVFGGVIDNEGDHHIIESIFYNDLFIFDMDRKRWMSVQLLKDDRAKQDEEDVNNVNDTTVVVEEDSTNEEVKSNGFGLTELRQDMFAFTDGEGNIVFENIDGIVLNEEEGDDDEVEMDKGLASCSLSTTSDIPDASTKTRRLKGKKGKGKKVDLKKLPPVLPKIRDTPLPRINCASIIRNNTLYIYGGLVEVGDREVTLDDCWSIDVNKCDKKWNCIYPGRMHKQVWKGVDSDNDSYISSDQGADDDADSDDDDVAEFEPILEADADVDDINDVDDDDNVEESKMEAEKRAKKEAKKANDKEKRRAIRNEVAELKEQLDDDNEVRKNPLLGESITEFYSRTTQYWDEVERLEVTNQGKSILTKDMIECEGLRLANIRYDEVQHIRERLDMLERLQLEYDEKKAKKKTDKKLKKDRLR